MSTLDQTRSGFSWLKLTLVIGLVLSALGSPVAAQTLPNPIGQTAQDLKRLSLDELTQLEVTTVSRRPERLSDAPAAVTVIRQDELRRAGVTTLAQALRLADALHVSQAYGEGWAISARGFNIATSNKLLVLIDGRTVYSPLFSGVFWEVQDLVLQDIDRIEVVRGPGGTLWGANAVNGVINVITKAAADTRGAFVSLAAGDQTQAIATARYGGRVGSAGAYRVYGKFRAVGAHVFATGAPANDDFQFGQTGFRVESDRSAAARWLVQGDVYRGSAGLYDRPDTQLSGGNILTRWEHRTSSTSNTRVQLYYDRTYRRVQRQYKATRDTVDIDAQQQLQVHARHTFVFGAGFRASRGDDLGDGPGFFFDPQVRTSTLGSAFAQDEITIRPDRLFVTVGSKFERNDFTGTEIQPNVRLRWTATDRQTVWGAVSRAVRMPTRFDTDLRIRTPNSGRLLITGSEDFQSENVIAYEGGYRVRPLAWLAVDIAGFANRYDDLRSQEAPDAPGEPIALKNTLNARTSGVEFGATAKPARWWQLHGSYSYLHEAFSTDPGSRDLNGQTSEANDPSNLFALRSSVDLPHRLEFDAFLRHVGPLPNPAVDGYTELNLRLGWHVRPSWELAVVGDNLLHARHLEFAGGTPREPYERNAFIRSTWAF
jgi:iron complex outermembrane receptor protein